MFWCAFWWVVSVTVLLLIASAVYEFFKKGTSINGRHVVITGGSSGIGKSIAIEAAKQGAHVTIIARNPQRLEEAVCEISKAVVDKNQRVQSLSLDISKDYSTIEKALLTLDEDTIPVFMLVNCAGAAVCGKLEDTSPKDIEQQLSLNLLGTIFPTKALIGRMKSRGEGILVITGSQASLLGVYGYSAYSSSKFALRGFAETVHMESKNYGISVTLALPPDTDTPGFANEEKSKPLETRAISETAGLLQPDVVGKQILKDALHGAFFSYVGFESFIMCTLCAGMSPLTTVTALFTEVSLMGILRMVSAGYLVYFNYLIKKIKDERNRNKKTE